MNVELKKCVYFNEELNKRQRRYEKYKMGDSN